MAEEIGLAPVRVRERRQAATSFGFPDGCEERVVELPAGEAAPEGAEVVADGILPHDWRHVKGW